MRTTRGSFPRCPRNSLEWKQFHPEMLLQAAFGPAPLHDCRDTGAWESCLWFSSFQCERIFHKSCHYWLGSLSPQTGRTHGSSRVIFYLGQKLVFVLQLFIVRTAPFGKLTLSQGPLCIYYTKVAFWAQKCTPPHPHKPVCPPPLSAYCSPGSPVRLHTVTRSSV